MEELTTEASQELPPEHSTSTTKAEPDWEELCDYEPSRNNIQAFHNLRDKRLGAMHNFEDFMDEIHAALRNDMLDSILQIAINLHEEHETRCIELEDEIEHFVMQNHRRRQYLREKLLESEQQAQGMFAKLQARLSH